MSEESEWERRAPAVQLKRGVIEGRLARALPGARLRQVTPLAGGNSNTVLRLELEAGPPLVMRLHQHADGGASCAREAELLRRLRGAVPVPALLATEPAPEDGAPPWLLLGWCEGQRLCDVWDDLTPADGPALGAALGRVAATIHAAGAYPRAGFLTPGLELSVGLGALGEHLGGWLDGRAGARLGPALAGRLRAWVAAREAWFADGPAVLCHADFKPTNLLVARGAAGWEPSAVLDWEFAFAGPRLFDLGQLLRHEERLPAGFAAGVEGGYAQVGPDLPPDWRARAAALDLLNHLQFLDDPAERPNVHAAARQRIEATLVRWP